MKNKNQFETEEEYREYLSKPFGYFSYSAEGDFELHQTVDEARKAAEISLQNCSEEAADYSWSDTVQDICFGKILGEVRQTLSLKREDCNIDEDDYDKEHDITWQSDWDEFAKYELFNI